MAIGAAISDAGLVKLVPDSGGVPAEPFADVAGDCEAAAKSSGAVRNRSGDVANGLMVDGEYDEPSDEVGDVKNDCVETCCLS
uniref:Secreted protein n=1 Tax=Angiostrongylus cantonensis TaxID=6313 RepID=A0A0K0CUQ8_ANGCA